MNNWRQKVGNGLVVTVVAAMLWFWAAGRTQDARDVNFEIRILTPDPERLLVEPTEPITVELSLRGERRELDRAADKLAGRTIDLRIGRDGLPGTAGEHTIELATLLRRSEAIGLGRVSVVSLEPEQIEIQVVEVETVNVAITPVLPGVELAGDPSVEPRTARIVLPRSLLPALGTNPRIEAFLPPAQSGALQPDRNHALDVELRLPDALAAQRRLIRIEPERARVHFRILSRSGTTTLRRVPVQIAGPPVDLNGYRVAINDDDAFLREVEVRGPSEAIEALDQGRATILAFIHLSATDLAERIPRAQIDLWMLPDGVTVTKIGSSTDVRPMVRIDITERARQ